MVDTNKLRGIFAERNVSQADVAEMLHITPKTMYLRMKSGKFDTDQAQIMVEKLDIQNPMEIFFARG